MTDIGKGITVTAVVLRPMQPFVVPVTVYEVVVEGLTRMLAVVAPVFQLYDAAPLALIVTVLPIQMELLLALRFTTTVEGITEMAIVAVLVQPVLVPLTV
jgi:hypothetical protein